MPEKKELEQWVALLARAELPVLKQTSRELILLRGDENNLSAHTLAEIISRDPIMTVKLLRYLQGHKHKSQTSEVMQVDQALMMLGLDSFFNHVPAQPLVEEMLKENISALPRVLRVIHRSHRASEYARDWALLLHDLHFEEVRGAALLHDIAEILMWCFNPAQMLEIRDLQEKDRSLRSSMAQEQVLGFSLRDLQHELATRWGLPKLLLKLMDDASAQQERVRNVVLAVNLARHSANGWDDAALPDDYKDIGALLGLPATEVMGMVAPESDSVCGLNKPH